MRKHNIQEDGCEISRNTDEGTLSAVNQAEPTLDGGFDTEENGQPTTVENNENKKKNFTKAALIMLAAVLVGFVLGYLGVTAFLAVRDSKEKEFQIGEMSICLTEGFEQSSSQAFQGIFSSRNMAVFVNRDGLDYSPAFISGFNPDQYAEYVILSTGIDSKAEEKDGLTYFIFSAEGDEGKMYKYYAYVFKTEEAFWLIQFSVEEGKAEKHEKTIESYAKSIKFN